MKGFIDRLYYGELDPEEQIVPPEEKYHPLMCKICEEGEYFRTKLSAEDGERLEHLDELYGEESSLTCHAGFTCGFRLGALMMQELLTQDGGN